MQEIFGSGWGEGGGRVVRIHDIWANPLLKIGFFCTLSYVCQLCIVKFKDDTMGVKAYKALFLGKTSNSHSAYLLQVYKVYNYMHVQANLMLGVNHAMA